LGALAALALTAVHLGGATAQTAGPALPAPPALSFAASGDETFDAWRADFAARAVASGRQPGVVQALLQRATPDPTIIQLDRNQAEFISPPWTYMNGVVSAQRLNAGMTKKAENGLLFSQVQAKYGVDSDIVAGIWAVETNFGAAPLRYDAESALATLAFDLRRRARFEQYLLALMQMVERGYAGPAELKSSWAGAMGQPQFMPDAYLTYAADWDGDGRRDIWNNTGDVLASISNYLLQHGWKSGGPIVEEVRLPATFNYALADNIARPLSEWASLSVTRVDGAAWSPGLASEQGKLLLLAGYQGPALLVFPNFEVIKTYNNSDRYALAVALLARGFEGGGGLVRPWPTQLGVIQRGELVALQESLSRLGYPAGESDGMFGANTRRAVRAFQLANGLPADGYPTPGLADKVRALDPGATPAADVKAQRVASLASERASSKPLGSAGIKQLQRNLAVLGYGVGVADGKPGAKTRAAIMAEERKLGLKPTGAANNFILAQTRRRVADQRGG
jgi:membrane-bound lytic murein transglycosylase B